MKTAYGFKCSLLFALIVFLSLQSAVAVDPAEGDIRQSSGKVVCVVTEVMVIKEKSQVLDSLWLCDDGAYLLRYEDEEDGVRVSKYADGQLGSDLRKLVEAGLKSNVKPQRTFPFKEYLFVSINYIGPMPPAEIMLVRLVLWEQRVHHKNLSEMSNFEIRAHTGFSDEQKLNELKSKLSKTAGTGKTGESKK